MTAPMRMTQRRRMVQLARDQAEAMARREIAALLDRQFKTLKRELRHSRVSLRKRLAKNDGALYKQNEDWGRIIGDFTAKLLEILKRGLSLLFGAENEFWTTRGHTYVTWDPNEVIAAYQNRIGRQISQIGDDTLAQTQQIIATWFAGEGSLPDLIQQLEPLYSADRAELIATTEMCGLASEAAYNMMNHFGITQWRWDAIMDGVVCEACADLNGQTFDTEDNDAYPPEHSRCRCGVYFVEDSAGQLAAFIA